MICTIIIIALVIALAYMLLLLYRKNVTIKSLQLDKKDADVLRNAANNRQVKTDPELIAENEALKAKIEVYHVEASNLNRKVYQLKQEVKSLKANATV